jgi:hypothetical protein
MIREGEFPFLDQLDESTRTDLVVLLTHVDTLVSNPLRYRQDHTVHQLRLIFDRMRLKGMKKAS